MKTGMTMKRWLWIPAMAPVMWAFWQFVLSADRLHAWQYSDKYPPPTQADYTYAAIVFWTALLTPLAVGLVTAVTSFRREYSPRWIVGEMSIVSIPFLVLVGDVLFYFHGTKWVDALLWPTLFVPSFVIGGIIVMTMLNLGACVRHRTWGKLALSALVLSGGTLYLFWLYAFVIYVDT